MNKIILGVDIGGSHITASLVNLQGGQLVESSIKRKAVDSLQDKEVILSAWCKVIEASVGDIAHHNIQIGIAMPGPFDYDNGISLIKDQDKFRSLYLANIKNELAIKLGIDADCIKFINDAAAFLQGEVFCGAAKGYDRALGVTLGTGLGSAVTVNGNATDAALWNSSFREGIAEDYLSTRWFLARYKSLTGISIDGVKELTLLASKDVRAMQVFKEFGFALGEFLTTVIKQHSSQVVVLGGNIAQAFELFEPTLTEKLNSAKLNTKIKLTELNENATLIGAAACWGLEQEESIEL